ncbi:MAG TPA: hypothetical protein VEU47_13875 [Candidatus Cybelea sp.]|nr:hypothetical protein [Candidatus Cybelea sp.]
MRTRSILLAALVLMPLAASPADAQNGLDRIIGGTILGKSSKNPPQNQQAQPNSDDTSAVALVESVEGQADGLKPMDYVFEHQQLHLSQGAKVTLSHLDGCLVEHVTGGTLTVARGGSTDQGGNIKKERAGNCEPAKPVVAADAREAGATINRITPFQGKGWIERVTKSGTPTFVWPRGMPGKSTVRVFAMDAKPPMQIWQGETNESFVAYPKQAPALARGMPYKVEVAGPDGHTLTMLFLVDPDLDLPNTLASRTVAVDQ